MLANDKINNKPIATKCSHINIPPLTKIDFIRKTKAGTPFLLMIRLPALVNKTSVYYFLLYNNA